ncbi:hypothetical protein V8E53_014092 [Lactarius tabidus]
MSLQRWRIPTSSLTPRTDGRSKGQSAADLIWGTPEAFIEQNTFYLQLKLVLGQRNQEVAGLKEASINQRKELDDLKARYKTLDKVHKMAIAVFAEEYHAMKATSGNGKRQGLSFMGKAHSVWEALLSEGYALKTWGRIKSVRWEYYAWMVLNKPGLEFLRLCDDSQWKLREWSQQNYLGWAKRRGIREAHAKKEPVEAGALDNKDLIQIDPNDNKEPEDIDIEESADLDDTVDSGSGTSEGTLLPNGSRATRGVTNPVPPPAVNAATNTAVTPNEVTPDLEMMKILKKLWQAPLLQSLTQKCHPMALTKHTTLTTPQADVKAASASDATSSAQQLLHPRIVFKLGPSPNSGAVVTAEGNPPRNPPPTDMGPSNDPEPSAQDSGTMSTNSAPHNLRLEHAQALLAKKRKPEDKVPCTLNKKQKSSPPAPPMLTVPTERNYIQNICMQQWNEQQPRGQGLTADFAIYFKNLSEVNKEPFKREMCAVQGANIKKSEGSVEVYCKYNACQLNGCHLVYIGAVSQCTLAVQSMGIGSYMD